jgi:hypothetical protein
MHAKYAWLQGLPGANTLAYLPVGTGGKKGFITLTRTSLSIRHGWFNQLNRLLRYFFCREPSPGRYRSQQLIGFFKSFYFLLIILNIFYFQ